MNNEKNKVYLPHEREYMEAKPKLIKAYSAVDYTLLPDPVRDPIVSNNIADREFNYTYNNEEDIWNEDF